MPDLEREPSVNANGDWRRLYNRQTETDCREIANTNDTSAAGERSQRSHKHSSTASNEKYKENDGMGKGRLGAGTAQKKT